MTVRIFFDTEFSSFEDPWLLSLGFVAETGETLYVVVADYDASLSSAFVKDEVVPKLTLIQPDFVLPERELPKEVVKWLGDFGDDIMLVCDYPGDWYLFLDFASDALHSVKTKVKGGLWSKSADEFVESSLDALEEGFWNMPENVGLRHNALVDAKLLRLLVLNQETLS